MADRLFLELVSPEKSIVSSEVDEVMAQGVEGEFGLLVGHAPFCTELKEGDLVYKNGSVEQAVTLSGGFLEVSDNKVVVLAEKAEVKTQGAAQAN